MVDDDHLALVIGDVSGKGVAAALFMVITKTLIKNRTQLGESPKTVLEKVNNQLCEGNDAEMFVTAWIGVYEISTGKLTAANAGHEYPAVCRKGGRFERYQDRHGFVLAGMEDMRYTEYELTLEPGDILVVYTDGVTEAVDGEEKLFTEERMLKSLDGAALHEPEELLKNLKKDIDTFTGDTPQFDDITMLCLKRNEGSGRS
jgi:sigma-B regulation protein RsbU (phosphoserine phosphatase)